MTPLSTILFAPRSRLHRDAPVPSQLPLVRNGPPASWVVFPDGHGLGIPTDQILNTDVAGGGLRVEFGGMRFDGLEEGSLVFRRAVEVWPEHQLAPERGRVLKVPQQDIASVTVEGRQVWPL